MRVERLQFFTCLYCVIKFCFIFMFLFYSALNFGLIVICHVTASYQPQKGQTTCLECPAGTEARYN